ncbi:MAG: Na+/H+ antiporter NhaA [Pseudomonadota bacterium]
MKRNKTLTTLLKKEFESISWPFKEFIRDQKTSNYLLIIATILSIFLANSYWSELFTEYNNSMSGFYIGGWVFEMSNQDWINNALMTLFFYVIGLEIKRELLAGELVSFRINLTILAAALGGMIFPALIYYFLNVGEVGVRGWGIPMATDTAFAVGVLALLSHRIPIAVTTFLTALAIFDDIGAVLVIAFFYINELHIEYLYQAAFIFFILLGMNYLGVRTSIPYLLGGIFLWFAIHASGIHAAISGILAAMTVPAKPKHEPGWFITKTLYLLRKFKRLEQQTGKKYHILAKQKEHDVISDIERVAETSTTPLQRWEQTVRRPITLFILPLFALSNAGIPINLEVLPETLKSYEFWGIFLGLVLGKCLGISLCAWLILKTGFADLPKNVTMQHIIGIGLLGGMGFTMSIFIAGIGFSELNLTLINAKTAILAGSLVAGILGYLWMYWISRKPSSH